MNCSLDNSLADDGRPAVPDYLYLVLTTSCNLRCQQCYIWAIAKPLDELALAARLKIIDEFAELSECGNVVITGGEPLLAFDELLALAGRCARHGLTSIANTNGTVQAPGMVASLCSSGLNRLVFSLDSHRPQVHDFARNADGTFDKAVAFMEELVKYRAGAASDLDIYAHCFVFERNYRSLSELVEFARGLGIDGIQFQLLSPSFAVRDREDTFYQQESCQDRTAASAALRAFSAKYAEDPFVVTRSADLLRFADYLHDAQAALGEACESPQRHLMIDVRGEIQLCFNMRSVTGGKTVGNTRQATLGDLWRSAHTARMRKIMQTCRRDCSLLACHHRRGS